MKVASKGSVAAGTAAPSDPIEARLFQGGLAGMEWTFRGRRSRVFVLQAGSGSLTFAEQDVAVAGPAIVWIPADANGSILFEAGAEGGTLAIPDVLLGSAMPVGAIFSQVRDAITRPILGARLATADARQLLSTIAAIDQELRLDVPGAQEAVRHHLALLLLQVWRLSKPSAEQAQPSPRMILRGFVHLVELHAREHWSLAEYANTLGVTADRLNTAVRRATGRTPMELIHSRLVAEAAMLLDGSAMQIAEIANVLGFKDPAYFSRFFKRVAGHSPKAHRQDAAMKRTAQETNFAAWP